MSLGHRDHRPGKTALTTPNSYFTSVFVSLGVFLFGYDQGVMSGIITFVYPLLFLPLEFKATPTIPAYVANI